MVISIEAGGEALSWGKRRLIAWTWCSATSIAYSSVSCRVISQAPEELACVDAVFLARHACSADDHIVSEAMAVRLTNDISELPRLAQWIEEFCENHDLPPAVAFSFDLALEEAVTNVITYGYADQARHEIEVRMSVDEGTVRAEVTDDGRPFDPREVAPPDVSARVEDRPMGGLGALLIRKSMDDVDYQVVDGRNRLTLSRRLT